ncbi:hypothetical protein [Salipiger thiooxidans]|uniref:hypothetical protein n=1 Tax=Salipiger thiooxidans TaxID=282683 RepID=UPI001CD38A28|nr:hypothetical protein [Salipiger thiooxidans]MCA0851489.1 hypothetical protein [Salipiger thiooxidans]
MHQLLNDLRMIVANNLLGLAVKIAPLDDPGGMAILEGANHAFQKQVDQLK